MAALDCLDTLVGLAAEAPSCFVDPEPEGFATSDSGYFIIDSEFGLRIIEACEIEGWTVLERARNKGILQFKTGLSAALRTRYGSAISPFSGLIGKIEGTTPRAASNARVGLRIRVRRMVKGGKIVLKKAFLGLDTSGNYAVSVTSNDPLFTEPTPVTVAAVANTYGSGTSLGLIELPMWSASCPETYLEYFVSIPLSGAMPLNNKLTCCGNSQGWAQHLDVAGFNTDSDTPTTGNFTSAAFGMVLDAYLSCGELDWLCGLEEINGYYAQSVVARTIQFAGAAAAIDELINTYKINVCTHYNQDEMNSRRNWLLKQYAENIMWLAANVPQGATGCFNCHPQKAFHRTAQITTYGR